MAPSKDTSLLDRLNALKPTTVNLDRSTNALSIPTTGIHHAEPLPREDALSERLRSLRNRRHNPAGFGDPPPPYTPSGQGKSFPVVTDSDSHVDRAGTQASAADDDTGDRVSQSPGEYDHYFEHVLQPLDLDDAEDSDSDSKDGRGDEHSQRVEDLLAKLRADPGAQPPLLSERKPLGSKGGDVSDDDSDGEAMSQQVENVLSRAMDDLGLDSDPVSEPAGPEPDTTASPGHTWASDDCDDEYALPTVPQNSGIIDNGEDAPTTSLPGDNANDNDTETTLSLPTVPTKLVDPDPGISTASRDPFESSIAIRLAALKGSAVPIHTDAFGLPSAPTFQPADRPAPGAARNNAAGYTDDDQKTWCIVCLDDATIRCLGCCDDGGGGANVYCARCWKEMHVGPAAGYDERGHAWVKFDPRRV